MFMFFSQRNRGFTFVEVVIALVLGALVSIALYGSSIYTMRQTSKSVEQIFGIQQMASARAKVRAARYNRLTVDSTAIAANEYEKQFFTTPVPIKLDPLNDRSTTYTVTYKLSGYGRGCTIQSASGPYVIDMSLPVGSASWKENQYQGHSLVIVAGAGINQFFFIKKHEASRVDSGKQKVRIHITSHIDNDEDDDPATVPDESWLVEP